MFSDNKKDPAFYQIYLGVTDECKPIEVLQIQNTVLPGKWTQWTKNRNIIREKVDLALENKRIEQEAVAAKAKRDAAEALAKKLAEEKKAAEQAEETKLKA